MYFSLSSQSEGSPFDFLDDDVSSASGSESDRASMCIADKSGIKAVVRGGLISKHLDPISARNWKAVLSWIAFHPNEVSTFVDREGLSSLHHACLFRAPLDVIEAMIFAASELTTVRNDHGELPLHWAIRLSLSLKVLCLLLETNPTSGFAMDIDGTTPLSLLWDRHENFLKGALRTFGKERVTSSHGWKRIMMLVTSYVANYDAHGYPLHAIVQTPCEPSFLMFATQLFHDELKRCDGNGRLPLHLASMALISPNLLESIIASHPSAASVADANGLLPLELAIASGKMWNDGVELIFLANPSAASHCDPATGLCTFMQAATSPNPCLTTIYSILLESPELAYAP